MESFNVRNDYESVIESDTRKEVTYLAFIGGDQPTPNACGLIPKNPKSEWTGWGGPIDTDNATIGEGVGTRNRIVIGGVYYKRGIGTSAIAKIVYDLTGRDYIRFEGYLGLPDETDPSGCGHGGSVVFRFEVDGREVFRSQKLQGNNWGQNTKPVECTFNIPEESKELTIYIDDAGDSICADHGVIGDAKLIAKTPYLPTLSTENENTDDVYIDVNGDGDVNLVDLVIVASNFGAVITGNMQPNPDVNRDGVVNKVDILLIIDIILI